MTYEEMFERINRRNLKRAVLGLPAEHEFEYNNAKYHWGHDRIFLKEVMLKDGIGEFEIPEFVTDIYRGHSYSPYRSPFRSCRSIKVINRSKIEDMGYLFYDCIKLEELDLSCFDTSKVFIMKGMFRECTHLAKLRLNSFDTSQVIDMAGMFSGCVSLLNLDLSSFDTSNVENTQGMFDSCMSLTSLDLSSFTAPRLCNATEMFRNCTELRSIDLSSFDTSKSIFTLKSSAMFSGCDNLSELRADEIITNIFQEFRNR